MMDAGLIVKARVVEARMLLGTSMAKAFIVGKRSYCKTAVNMSELMDISSVLTLRTMPTPLAVIDTIAICQRKSCQKRSEDNIRNTTSYT